MRLADDLAIGYDYVILTGQAPRSSRVALEAVALNLASHAANEAPFRLVEDGPLAYETSLPVGELCERIRGAGVPAAVSYHAGTYLCNASLYLTLHTIAIHEMATQAVFVHLPLEPSQVAQLPDPVPSMPAQNASGALLALLEGLTPFDGEPPELSE